MGVTAATRKLARCVQQQSRPYMVWLQSTFIALPHDNHLSILLRNACRINEEKKKMEGKKKGREEGRKGLLS